MNGWADTWHQHRADGYYRNGTYRLQAAAGGEGQDAQPTNAPHNLGRNTLLNLSISVDARRIAGSPQNIGYSIICRADGKGDSYSLGIYNNSVFIAKSVDGGNKGQGPPSRVNNAVRVNATNRLRAICVTSDGGKAVHLAFWVNGTKVADWTDRNHPYTQGYLGVMTASDPLAKMMVEAEFDNFVVVKL